MAQFVVHIKKEGAPRTEPAYAVWVSDKLVSVRPFGPQWRKAANGLECILSSHYGGHAWMPEERHPVGPPPH